MGRSGRNAAEQRQYENDLDRENAAYWRAERSERAAARQREAAAREREARAAEAEAER